MKAVKNNVIVEISNDTFTKEGSIIVNEIDKLPTEGIVEAVGPTCIFGLKKGDKIKFREQPGDLFEYNGKRYYSMPENRIFGTI